MTDKNVPRMSQPLVFRNNSAFVFKPKDLTVGICVYTVELLSPVMQFQN